MRGKKLTFIFDVDGTLTQYSGRETIDLFGNNQEQQLEAVTDGTLALTPNVGKMFKEILADKNCDLIISSQGYLDVIKQLLTTAGLSQEQIAKITIYDKESNYKFGVEVSGGDSGEFSNAKLYKIRDIIHKCNSADNAVVLFDDDKYVTDRTAGKIKDTFKKTFDSDLVCTVETIHAPSGKFDWSAGGEHYLKVNSLRAKAAASEAKLSPICDEKGFKKPPSITSSGLDVFTECQRSRTGNMTSADSSKVTNPSPSPSPSSSQG